MSKLQIKTIYEDVIFEYDCENNTIRKTVKKCIEEKKSLSYANLSYANLSCADLSYANLSCADLSYADLSYADLSSANLSYADLRSANLYSANLYSANLSCANLSYANLSCADLRSANLRYSKNKETAYLPLFCKWGFSIIGNNIEIGCKTKSIEEWDIFFKSEEEFNTKRNTEDFKQIEAVYLGYKAYLTHLKNKL